MPNQLAAMSNRSPLTSISEFSKEEDAEMNGVRNCSVAHPGGGVLMKVYLYFYCCEKVSNNIYPTMKIRG